MTANSAVTGVRKYLLSRPVNFTAPTVLGLGDRDQDFLKRLVEAAAEPAAAGVLGWAGPP